MVGSCENNVGHFFAKDTFKGKPIIMMFRWDARDKEYPIWSQAFSPDDGKAWEHADCGSPRVGGNAAKG